MSGLPEPVEFFRRTEREEELAVARALRKASPSDRWQFIEAGLKSNELNALSRALELVRTARLPRENLLAVLRMGLDRGDASSIKFWIKAVLPGLGLKRVASELKRQYEVLPAAVAKALYWLPSKDATLKGLKERATKEGFLRNGGPP